MLSSACGHFPLNPSRPLETLDFFKVQVRYYRLVRSKKMFEDISKNIKWSWNSYNSKHGDEIGVGGQKLKLTNIGIELHVGSPLPSE